MYKRLYPSWYKSRSYPSRYKGDDHGNNKMLSGKRGLKLKMRHVRF